MMNMGSFMILMLYIDDILITSKDVSLLNEIKKTLSQHFNMKDLGDTSFVLGIESHCDNS